MYANSTDTRFYKDNTLTFSVATGSITSVVFTCSKYQTDITSDVGTCTATGSASSVSSVANALSSYCPDSRGLEKSFRKKKLYDRIYTYALSK